jgi:hypothetical protein
MTVEQLQRAARVLDTTGPALLQAANDLALNPLALRFATRRRLRN